MVTSFSSTSKERQILSTLFLFLGKGPKLESQHSSTQYIAYGADQHQHRSQHSCTLNKHTVQIKSKGTRSTQAHNSVRCRSNSKQDTLFFFFEVPFFIDNRSTQARLFKRTVQINFSPEESQHSSTL